MWLWQSFKASVYDPAFHRSMKERSAGKAFGYFSLLMFAYSVVIIAQPLAAVAGFAFRPSEEFGAVRQQAADLYPDWLEFRTGGGTLSTNAESPYAIPMPLGFVSRNADAADLPANLLVINTDKPIESGDFSAYDALVILGKDEIGSFDPEKGKIEIQSMRKVFESPFVLDKGKYDEFIGRLADIVRVGAFFLAIAMPIAVFFGMSALYLGYLLFGAAVIWLAARLRSADWSYGTAYKAGLYLITLPALYGLIPDAGIPFASTVILFVLALLNASADGAAEAAAGSSSAALPDGGGGMKKEEA